MAPPPLILASKSRSRKSLLENAGLTFETMVAGVDEDPVKEAMLSEGAPARDIADMLAELKALAVSRMRPDAFVIGADQVLVCDGELFSKARNRTEAAAVLKALSGKSHQLISAVVVAEGGRPIWRTIDKTDMQVRTLSDDFIDHYLDQLGDDAYWSVGCYQLEGIGAQLFNSVKGDFFTVLGLPLLPLLDFLRRYEFIAT